MGIRIISMAVLFAFAGASTASAHKDHAHPAPAPPVDKEQATASATKQIPKLVEAKKLDASWIKAAVKGVEKKTYGKRWEWLVTFVNAAAKGKVLYVFLTPAGKFVAANFTGK